MRRWCLLLTRLVPSVEHVHYSHFCFSMDITQLFCVRQLHSPCSACTLLALQFHSRMDMPSAASLLLTRFECGCDTNAIGMDACRSTIDLGAFRSTRWCSQLSQRAMRPRSRDPVRTDAA